MPRKKVTAPTVDTTLEEETFSGDLKAVFAEDPLGVGHQVSGHIEGAISSLRGAAKAAAESVGAPAPVAYAINVSVTESGLALTFSPS